MRVQSIGTNYSNQNNLNTQIFGMKMIKFKEGTVWPEQILKISQNGNHSSAKVDFRDSDEVASQVQLAASADKISRMVSRARSAIRSGIVDLTKYDLTEF